MAKLILTQEEKDAPSYLDWDDATLGKMVRSTCANINAFNNDDVMQSVRGISVAVGLIARMIKMNADNLELGITDLKDGDRPISSYKLTIERISAPSNASDPQEKSYILYDARYADNVERASVLLICDTLKEAKRACRDYGYGTHVCDEQGNVIYVYGKGK